MISYSVFPEGVIGFIRFEKFIPSMVLLPIGVFSSILILEVVEIDTANTVAVGFVVLVDQTLQLLFTFQSFHKVHRESFVVDDPSYAIENILQKKNLLRKSSHQESD